MVNKQDDTSDHANQRRTTTLVRNTFNSTNMQSSSAIVRQEGQEEQRLIQQFQPTGVLSYMGILLDENMVEPQRLRSASVRGTDDKIVWWDQNKTVSTLEILDLVLDLLDDHECMYDDQENVLDDREDTKK